MTILETIIIAIVEGLTEFLPISSTGHMILTAAVLGMKSSDFLKLFTICIQFGAILSVLVIYWRKFIPHGDKRDWMEFYMKLFVAFLPAVFFGLFFKKYIDQMLESVMTVGVSLLLGGIVLLFVDKWLEKNEQSELDYFKAFKIGFFQVLAMIPGVSRSGATIVGGMAQGLTRAQAAEFSFFLAVPTMFAATAKDLLDYYQSGFVLNQEQINILLLGNVIAFIVAFLAIKSFIGFLNKHGFKVFGYYRIIVGLLVIAFASKLSFVD